MGHARGVICLAAAEAGIPVVHYPATQIKRILTATAGLRRANANGHSAGVAMDERRTARRG